MDKFLTNIWEDKEVLWKIAVICESAFCSVLCAVITQNIIITVIYILITALIDIIVAVDKYIHWGNAIVRMFRIKNSYKYLFFVGFALLPVICGILVKEIRFSGAGDIPSVFFVNVLPNVLGAFIVCSMIAHISGLGYEQFACTLLQSRKEFFNIVIRGFFWCCYLNAVNYAADDSWRYANYINSLYLFVIVSFGAVAVGVFLFRLMDKQPFSKDNDDDYTAKRVFPSWTLFASALFLFSCGAAPIYAKIGKHEPVLLCLNTITALIVASFLLKFAVRKTKKNRKEYPIVAFSGFCAFIIFNCAYNFYKWDRTGDIASQVKSGVTILAIVFFSLLYLNKMQKEALEEKALNEEGRMEDCG